MRVCLRLAHDQGKSLAEIGELDTEELALWTAWYEEHDPRLFEDLRAGVTPGEFGDWAPSTTGTENAYLPGGGSVGVGEIVWMRLAGVQPPDEEEEIDGGPWYTIVPVDAPLPAPGLRYQVLQLDSELKPVWDWVRAHV